MSSLLRSRPSSSPDILRIFGDKNWIALACRFEAALAQAQAEAGLFKQSMATSIARVCENFTIEPGLLADEAAHAGTLAIPLIAHLRAGLASVDEEAVPCLHRGTTSQDVSDTCLMMQVKDALRSLDDGLNGLEIALEGLARKYIDTPVLARTLLQPARATSFGLKAANWLAAIADARSRLQHRASRDCRLQLGGAAGTRGDMDGKGQIIESRVAEILGLLPSPLPWHARRNGTADIAASVGILVGSLGKTARDISLLSQKEIGELEEPLMEGRGGSSAIQHKRNPTSCQVALSAAIRAPGLVSTIFSAMPQEHERGLGGWQAEAPVLAELLLIAGGALEAMLMAIRGLRVYPDAMLRNLQAGGVDQDMGEAEHMARSLLSDYKKDRD